MKTRNYCSLPADVREDLRRKAVEAILSGKKQVEVARLYGITRQAVNNWMKAYRARGAKALKAKMKGRPRARAR